MLPNFGPNTHLVLTLNGFLTVLWNKQINNPKYKQQQQKFYDSSSALQLYPPPPQQPLLLLPVVCSRGSLKFLLSKNLYLWSLISFHFCSYQLWNSCSVRRDFCAHTAAAFHYAQGPPLRSPCSDHPTGIHNMTVAACVVTEKSPHMYIMCCPLDKICLSVSLYFCLCMYIATLL